MTHDTFKNIWNSNYELQRSMKNSVNDTIKTVNFDSVPNYRYGKLTQDGMDGVIFNIFDSEIWGWPNTINTNYSCHYEIIQFINEIDHNNKFNDIDFSNIRLNNTLIRYKELIEKHKQIIFTPGSKVFKNMFFITQKTWGIGIISSILGLKELSKKYNIEYNLEYKRGDDEDMKRGIDFKMTFGNSGLKNVQHKSAKIWEEGEFYVSKVFLYNEYTYRNNVDLISIQSGKTLYIFSNSTNKNLCGTRSDGKFFISETLKLDEMEIKEELLEQLLTKINLLCFEKQHIFFFERSEDENNKFEIDEMKGIKTLRLYINNIEDPNLTKMLEDVIEKIR